MAMRKKPNMHVRRRQAKRRYRSRPPTALRRVASLSRAQMDDGHRIARRVVAVLWGLVALAVGLVCWGWS